MSEDSETNWKNTKKLGAAALSMPAAVAVLDASEKNLQLSALLKRIVLNYDVLLSAVWSWLGSFLPLPPDLDIRFWSFFVLIISPAIAEYLRHKFTGRKITFGRPGFWGVASSIAFIGYCITFSTGGEMVAALIDYALFFLTLLVVVLICIGISSASTDRIKKLDLSERAQNVLFWIGFIAMILLFVLVLRTAVEPLTSRAYVFMGVSPDGGIRGIAIFATLCIAAVFAFGNLRTPAYVFFWLFGIIAVDRAAHEIVPSINENLDQILCDDGACS